VEDEELAAIRGKGDIAFEVGVGIDLFFDEVHSIAVFDGVFVEFWEEASEWAVEGGEALFGVEFDVEVGDEEVGCEEVENS